MTRRIIALLLILICLSTPAKANWITFNTLTGGNQSLSLFDTQFGNVAAMGQIQCTATGSNTLALTPVTNQPTVSAYSNYQEFGWVQPSTTTMPVTANINSLGALPIFDTDGVTQIGTSVQLTGSGYYQAIYNSDLNSGGGGLQLVSRTANSGGGTVNSGTANQLAYYASSGNAVSGTNALPSVTTATTQAVGDTSTSVATDAFAAGSFSLSTNGYVKYPSGLIEEWGTAAVAQGSATINLPTPFSTAVLNGQATMVGSNLGFAPDIVSISTTQIVLYQNNTGTQTIYWRAIGK